MTPSPLQQTFNRVIETNAEPTPQSPSTKEPTSSSAMIVSPARDTYAPTKLDSTGKSAPPKSKCSNDPKNPNTRRFSQWIERYPTLVTTAAVTLWIGGGIALCCFPPTLGYGIAFLFIFPGPHLVVGLFKFHHQGDANFERRMDAKKRAEARSSKSL